MAWGLKQKELGLTRKQRDAYSLSKALRVLTTPHSPSARKVAGFELDLSDQIKKRDNRESDGIIIPQEILDHGYRTNRPMPRSGHILTDQVIRGMPPPSHTQKRSISLPKRMQLQERTTLTAGTAATAGNLIDTELQSVVLTLVENTLALQNVPSYTVMGDPVYFPRQTGRTQASWGTEGVGPIEPEIASEDLAIQTFSNVATQNAVDALSGTKWAVITVSRVKYLAFKGITTADETILEGLTPGRQIAVHASDDSVETTFTINGAYDTSKDRIALTSDASNSGLTNGTDYTLKTNTVAAVTAESNPTYDRVSFSAKHLKCVLPITRTLLLQANENADDLIRGDIAIGNAKALDTAMFYGTGNKQPQGIKGTSDIVSTTWDAANIYDKILETWAQIGVANIPSRNLKWIGSWRFAHDCKRATKLNTYASDEQRVLGKDGTIDGVPVEVTSQIVGVNSQTAEGFLADWTEAALVLWQDLEVEIDPYSQLDKGIVRFVSTLICDFNVTRPKAFGRLGGS